MGASPDSPAAQKKFKDQEAIPFPLLADEKRELAAAYGVLKEKTMYGRKFLAVERTTFLIDAAGHVQQLFARVQPEGHAAEVLAFLRIS